VPNDDSAVVRLARAVARLGRKRLPVHVTAPARAYLAGLARALPQPGAAIMTLLQDERAAGPVLDLALRQPEIRRPLAAILSNTATPTVLAGGEKVNVVPASAAVLIDGRTLPGQGPGDIVREIEALCPELELEVLKASPSTQASHDTPAFRAIETAMRHHVPDGHVVPMLLPGMTDAKSWSRLGAQCYGFMPLPLPAGFPSVLKLIHGHDERVPIDSLRRGAQIFYEVVAALGDQPVR
jgi:acetylornithine deacetylase/succinyl-diaminopimelate desuccinylase-like protein